MRQLKILVIGILLLALLAGAVQADTYISDDTAGSSGTQCRDATGLTEASYTTRWYVPYTWKDVGLSWGPDSDGGTTSWNSNLYPSPEASALLASGADWIWTKEGTPGTVGSKTRYKIDYKNTTDEAVKTGEVVEFERHFTIPGGKITNIKAYLYIAADNSYYGYINKGFSGTPDFQHFPATIASSDAEGVCGATCNDGNFRYTAMNPLDPTKLMGGPMEGGVEGPSSSPFHWGEVKKWDVSSLVQIGDNTLEIVGINEHDGTATTNPGGVIYRLDVTYHIIAPEFPSVAVPAAFLVGLIGLLYFYVRPKSRP